MSRDRKTVEASEISFYKELYKNESFNQAGNLLRLKRELNSLCKLSDNKKLENILSIGCGTGQFELLLAPYTEHITAVDISPEAIEVANQKKQRLKIQNIDFKCKSFADISWNEQFDAIICLAFLHHVPENDLRDFLKKAYAHLNPNGFFYSQDPNVHGILRTVGRIILRDNYDKYHTPDERELDPNELIRLLKDVGFNTVKVNHLDLTLIPAIYMFKKDFTWLMYMCLLIDKVWNFSPFAKWASGFALLSEKSSKK